MRSFYMLVLILSIFALLCVSILSGVYFAGKWFKARRASEFAINAAWVETLFPHTAEPDEFVHRLQRLEISPMKVEDKMGCEVICRFIYPEIDGSVETGKVKFFLPPELAEQPGLRVPLIHVAGYEIDSRTAMEYIAKGIAVSTVHDHPLNPLARGPKLEWALMHAERRLSFFDDSRVMIGGAGEGGYMSLMMSAETFPLICSMAMTPVVNWAYNATYIAKSRKMASSYRKGSDEPWLPALASVAARNERSASRFGEDTESDAYFELSPVRWVEYITAPVAVVSSPADMIVPINQVNVEDVVPFDAKDFPNGFTMNMEAILSRPEQRVRLFDVLPEKEIGPLVGLIVPEGTGKYMADGRIRGEIKSHTFGYSPSHWSCISIDEGAPEPHVCHQKYAMNVDFSFFWQCWLDGGLRIEQITLAKLELLMKRYQGVQPLDFMVTPAGRAPHKAQLLDFPRAERADVLRGLITFAQKDEFALHLADLYASLPVELKAFGVTLGDGSAASVRQTLDLAETKLVE